VVLPRASAARLDPGARTSGLALPLGRQVTMKIHFCDLCNESVPQADLDEGRAFVRKDRVVCATCDRAMSAAEPIGASSPLAPSSPMTATSLAMHPAVAATAATDASSDHAFVSHLASTPPASVAHARESRGSLGVWIAVLAMAFTAVAIVVQNQRLEQAARQDRETRELALRWHDEVLDAQHRIGSELRRFVSDGQSDLAARIDLARKDTDAKLKDWRDETAKQWTALDGSVKGLSAWRDDLGAQSQDDKRRVADLSQRLAKSEDDARQLIERLQTLEQAAKAPPAPVAPVASGAGKNEPGWRALLVDLTSANAGVRWEAVDGLGQAHDPQAVPALIPMLKDPDVFVRMATARVLGDLKATSAVNGLLDALEDNEDAVREASFVALRAIAGNKDLKFDPLAPEAERAKRLKALREWWKKEEESGGAARG